MADIERRSRGRQIDGDLADWWIRGWQGLREEYNKYKEGMSQPEAYSLRDVLAYRARNDPIANRFAFAMGTGDIAGKGIRAYHGSPHDFDQFSMSKIGAGEGAQAYGHGLYFAEKEGVARSYRDALKWKGSDWNDPQFVAGQAIDFAKGDRESALTSLKTSRRAQIKQMGRVNPEVEGAIELLESGAEITGQPRGPGRMYEVNIKADREQFLDWDKPLSQQSEAVRKALAKVGIEGTDPAAMSAYDDALLAALDGTAPAGSLPKAPVDPQGAEIVRRLQGRGGSTWLDPNERADISAMNALREAGIPGIKYLDQGSRGAGDGTRNYVVFDDALVEILRKYGIAGLLGGGAAAGIMAPGDAEAAQRDRAQAIVDDFIKRNFPGP